MNRGINMHDDTRLSLQEIEALEHKYLMKYWYFLKFAEDDIVVPEGGEELFSAEKLLLQKMITQSRNFSVLLSFLILPDKDFT